MEKLLSPQELSNVTGLKVSYLYHLTHYRRIPFLKLGNTVKFRLSEIEKWLVGCERKMQGSALAEGDPLAGKTGKQELKRKRNTDANKKYLNMIEKSARKEVFG